MTRKDIQDALDLKDRFYLRESYIVPALNLGLIEMTIPDKPRSSKQKYVTTEEGRKLLEQ